MRKLKRGPKATNNTPTVNNSLVRRVSSRRCARSPEGERAHRLELTSPVQDEALLEKMARAQARRVWVGVMS